MVFKSLFLGACAVASFAAAQNNNLVGGLTHGVNDIAQDTTQNVGNAVPDTAQDVGNAVQNTAQGAGHVVQNAVQNTGDAVGTVDNTISNAAQNAGNTLQNVGNTVAQDVSNIEQAALSITQGLHGVTTGKEIDIHYKAPNINEPVKILLRKGDPNNLKTISTVTDNALGGTFQWTPAKNLVSGADYALQFVQGAVSNYYGPFDIAGVTIPVYHPHPATPTYVAAVPLATASGSPALNATSTSYTFTRSAVATGLGLPRNNVTVLVTGTGGIMPTSTILTYVSPTITPGSQVTVTAPGTTHTGAASMNNVNIGLIAGLFGVVAYLN